MPERVSHSDVERESDSRADLELLLAALAVVDVERSIVVIRDLEGLPYQQIAEAMEVPLATVKSGCSAPVASCNEFSNQECPHERTSPARLDASGAAGGGGDIDADLEATDVLLHDSLAQLFRLPADLETRTQRHVATSLMSRSFLGTAWNCYTVTSRRSLLLSPNDDEVKTP